jgi:hypothetical protein
MAWEDVDQVSFAVCGTPTDKPGQEQHNPLDRLTSTWGKKRNWLISNKNNKDTRKRRWGALSTEDWGKRILPGTVNKQARWAGEALVGTERALSNQEQEGLWEWRREENSTGEEGRPNSHVNCKQTWRLAGAAALPSNQEQESMWKWRWEETPQRRAEDPPPTWTLNKNAGLTTQVQCYLSHCAWKGESL